MERITRPYPVPNHRIAEWLATPEGPPQGLPAQQLELALANALDEIEWRKWRIAKRHFDPSDIASEVCERLKALRVLP